MTLCLSPVVGMSVHGDHSGGAAMRRRDRLLRMHWRDEQLTLQMALAAALHSRDVGPVTYNAPRSWKTSVAGDTEFFWRQAAGAGCAAHRGADC